jgi:hypothetical protein
MATERFPRARYLRQLAQLQSELLEWKFRYRNSTAEHQDDWIGSRFALRAEQLDGVIDQVVRLRDSLYGLSRLS